MIHGSFGSEKSKENIQAAVRRQSGAGALLREFLCGGGRVCGDHGRERFRKDHAFEHHGCPRQTDGRDGLSGRETAFGY